MILQKTTTKNNLVAKTIAGSVLVFLFSMPTQAQSKNVTKTTKTTTRTVNTPAGEKKFVKEQKTTETQKIEMDPEKTTLNMETVPTPVVTTSTTKITNPDGSTRTVDIDRTGFYQSNGTTFKLELDAGGYVMTYGTAKPALLRRTSTNSYIYRAETRTAIGYFDLNGDLNVEVYDTENDRVILEKYHAVK